MRRRPNRLDVVQRHSRQLHRDPALEPRLLDEREEAGRRDGEPRRHRDLGGDELAERRALAAEAGAVGAPELGQMPGMAHSTIVTVPSVPSTRIRCPVLICDVARPVPTTAGRAYSRHTIAACDMTPPMSVTAAVIFEKIGAQAGDVMLQTRISPSR